MIGLGSNRLTVCRRGGMSVTQAGSGGMEWLAGYRDPSWASPYSAQATAALKAQFPTQWPTIRDYGFAHPEYIAAINFAAPQDPEIMYSLIAELGKTRFCVGDGTAWFSTGFIPLGSDLEFGVKFKILQAGQGNKGIFGKGSYSNQIANAIYATCWTPGGYPNLVMFGWQGKHGDWSGDTSGSKYDYLWDFHYILKSGAIRFISTKDGAADKDNSYTNTINYTDDSIPMYMFKGNNAGAAKAAVAFGYAKQNGVEKFNYIPCKHNGAAGMLDLVTATWKGNEAGSGSFTISDTPAS